MFIWPHLSPSLAFSLPSCLIHFLPQQLPGLILSGSTSTALGFTAGPLFIRCFLLPLQLRSSWVWLNICPKVLLVEMRITPQQSSGGGGAYECEADLSYCRSTDGAARRSARCSWVGDTLIRPELFSLRSGRWVFVFGSICSPSLIKRGAPCD